jgi:hypothetical protein
MAMDEQAFLMQLAWMLARGPMTLKKVGATFVMESQGRKDAAGQANKITIPQSVVPWLHAMYIRSKKNQH